MPLPILHTYREMVSRELFADAFWSCYNTLRDASTDDVGMPGYFRFLTLLGVGRCLTHFMPPSQLTSTFSPCTRTCEQTASAPPQPLKHTGLHIFSRTRPDVVILEVGIGGRIDATNVLRAPLVTGVLLSALLLLPLLQLMPSDPMP
jgi:folylpolyglutamate synthase